MPLMKNFKWFTNIMRNIYQSEISDVEDIAIEVEDDLYSKKNTLNILKNSSFKINPLKVKKIVSLNQDGKFVVDSGSLVNTIFISDESLTQNDQSLFKKDQLVFVEDETDNTKIKIYKILFDESEGEIRPELGLLGSIKLSEFNGIFINSGLFKENDVLINQKINNLLDAPQLRNPFEQPNPVWDVEHYKINDYSSNSTMIENFKKHLNLVNVEKDYFIYRQGNEIFIKNVTDPNDTFIISTTAQNITDNDIFYLNKKINENGETFWETYKITKKPVLGWLYDNVKYQAYEFNPLTDQQFDDLKALSIPPQLGFTIEPTINNGLASLLKEEQQEIDLVAMCFLVNAPEVLPEDLPEPLQIANNISETLQNNSIEGLYSLVIEDGKIKISDAKSDPENVIFEQELSQENKNIWNNDIEVAGKYQKVYFAKNPSNNLVEKWVVIADQNQLQCIGTISLSELRKSFANNNLFPDGLKGIHCGENGAQVKVARTAAEQVISPKPSATKLSPVIVKNVINLKWDDSRKLWDLNITTDEQTLDKKLKLEKNENDILNNLIEQNKKANTVILFNKCDGKFLRAYYFDENNKKVNCSNKLSDEDKEQLSTINQKAKARVLEARTVTPILDLKSNLFLKNTKTFNFNIFNGKCYVLCNDELGIPLKAEVKLSPEQIRVLSYLAKNEVDFSLTFDKDDNFKSISYTFYRDEVKQNVTINRKDLSDSNNFNQKRIETDELMETIVTALNNPESLIPEDDGVTSKPWNSDTAAKVNGASLPSSTTQHPQQQQM
ncbi:hypothetical protein [Spiroplasma endosymbiont of Phycita roborella]|uniref:hypothetical protein n=1 Tax=Spiroplasma endosymbiont of Phycita roborella TaxID=3066311 RepID=UPI00313EF034